MSDYSDLIFLISAIFVFGLLTTDVSRAIVLNNQKLTDSEIEYGAISVAQDVIEEARWTSYNDLDANRLESYANTNIKNVGSDKLYQIQVSIAPVNVNGSSKPHKKVSVAVNSDYLTHSDGTPDPITAELIKTKY